MAHVLPYPPPWMDAATLAAHICIGEHMIDASVEEGRLPGPNVVGDVRLWKWATVEVSWRGRIYFIESAGLIKIGFSEQIKTRLATISAHSAAPIKLLMAMWGPQSLEFKVHQKFASLRQHGEWFRKSDEIFSFIEQNKAFSV